MIQANTEILHRSDSYRILNYKCYCDICSLSEPEYNNSFCVSFIRKGFFEYRVFRHQYEAHAGRLLISKPAYEHRARHIDDQPDVTTVFEFKPEFFDLLKEQYRASAGWFLDNNDLHALLLTCSIESDWLHHHILEIVQSKRKIGLQIDELVISLLHQIFSVMQPVDDLPLLNDQFKKYHLATVEQASEYIRSNFADDISLQSLARHCHVSPFHFSRIFKAALDISPHQFLLQTRLQQAKWLVTNSSKPVNDIAFECGFNSVEHFVTAYRQQFQISPTNHRRQLA
ncbi:MAG: AraC family transcriptional regulator [Bacteroidetes bacterium]|nr:MAG: AraC family transcriptional regulator [Bacteroidota bacterium]